MRANVFDVPRVTLVDDDPKDIVGEGTKTLGGSLLGPGRDRARREDGRPDDDAPIARPEDAVVRRHAGEWPRERIGRAVEIGDDDQTRNVWHRGSRRHRAAASHLTSHGEGLQDGEALGWRRSDRGSVGADLSVAELGPITERRPNLS